VLIALFAIRPVSTREISVFSALYGVEVTDEILPKVTTSIRRSRTAKLAGLAVGLSIYNVLFALGVTIPNQGAIYAVAGYLVGAFVTALIPLNAGAGVRKASLVPRVPLDYLPRFALIAPVLTLGVSAIAILIYELEPHPTLVSFSGSVAGLPVSAIAVAATYIAIRVLVSRPQPITSPGLTELDDAVRTQALHTICGSGLAIAFLGLSTCLFEMAGYSTVEWVRMTGIALAVLALGGMAGAWAFRRSEWRVHRAVTS